MGAYIPGMDEHNAVNNSDGFSTGFLGSNDSGFNSVLQQGYMQGTQTVPVQNTQQLPLNLTQSSSFGATNSFPSNHTQQLPLNVKQPLSFGNGNNNPFGNNDQNNPFASGGQGGPFGSNNNNNQNNPFASGGQGGPFGNNNEQNNPFASGGPFGNNNDQNNPFASNNKQQSPLNVTQPLPINNPQSFSDPSVFGITQAFTGADMFTDVQPFGDSKTFNNPSAEPEQNMQQGSGFDSNNPFASNNKQPFVDNDNSNKGMANLENSNKDKSSDSSNQPLAIKITPEAPSEKKGHMPLQLNQQKPMRVGEINNTPIPPTTPIADNLPTQILQEQKAQAMSANKNDKKEKWSILDLFKKKKSDTQKEEDNTKDMIIKIVSISIIVILVIFITLLATGKINFHKKPTATEPVVDENQEKIEKVLIQLESGCNNLAADGSFGSDVITQKSGLCDQLICFLENSVICQNSVCMTAVDEKVYTKNCSTGESRVANKNDFQGNVNLSMVCEVLINSPELNGTIQESYATCTNYKCTTTVSGKTYDRECKNS